jgi:hypothetical protein
VAFPQGFTAKMGEAGNSWVHNTHLSATFGPGFFLFKSRLKSFSANSMNLSPPSDLPVRSCLSSSSIPYPCAFVSPHHERKHPGGGCLSE